MINIFCDSHKIDKNSRMNIRSEGNTIIIECLVCGDMKRISNKEVKE